MPVTWLAMRVVGVVDCLDEAGNGFTNLCGVRGLDGTFDEPMEYPQGANNPSGACKPTSVVGSKTRA